MNEHKRRADLKRKLERDNPEEYRRTLYTQVVNMWTPAERIGYLQAQIEMERMQSEQGGSSSGRGVGGVGGV